MDDKGILKLETIMKEILNLDVGISNVRASQVALGVKNLPTNAGD